MNLTWSIGSERMFIANLRMFENIPLLVFSIYSRDFVAYGHSKFLKFFLHLIW